MSTIKMACILVPSPSYEKIDVLLAWEGVDTRHTVNGIIYVHCHVSETVYIFSIIFYKYTIY